MNYLTYIILIFSCLGALDRIFGNKTGIGAEFEKAFMLLGVMALSMVGMIVISPAIAELMTPVSGFFSEVLGIDPSIIPASLFANDMGGASLSTDMAIDKSMGLYNALVVSSMMGCTISYTVPFALGVVDKKQHNELLLGILCGVVTIPIGCFAAGLICTLPLLDLVLNLIPIAVFSVILAFGLVRFPLFCIKVFKVFGVFITGVITLGLALGIIRFLTGLEPIKGLATIEEGAAICVNAAIVLSGTFPLMYVISKLLKKPLGYVGRRLGMNDVSVICIISSLASSSATFGMMDRMNKKGVVMNAAFSVSGAFVLGAHLAFTMSFDSGYVLPVIVGKLVSSAVALIVANFIYKRAEKTQ